MTSVSRTSAYNQKIGLPTDGLNATSSVHIDQSTLSLRFEQATSLHFRQLRRERDSLYEYDMTQVLLLALASLIWDVFVVYFHLANPPHPKFRLRFVRRLSIYSHIWSGASEVVLSVVSFALYCNHEGVRRADCVESDVDRHTLLAVSYTHLTLPTICSV